MGWDAYAVRPDIDPRISDEERLTQEQLAFFRQASLEFNGTPSVGHDELGSGTLGGLFNGILTRATGILDYDEASKEGWLLWSPDVVRHAHAVARWDFVVEGDDDSPLRAEARLFLEVCALHDFAIFFTW